MFEWYNQTAGESAKLSCFRDMPLACRHQYALMLTMPTFTGVLCQHGEACKADTVMTSCRMGHTTCCLSSSLTASSAKLQSMLTSCTVRTLGAMSSMHLHTYLAERHNCQHSACQSWPTRRLASILETSRPASLSLSKLAVHAVSCSPVLSTAGICITSR